MSEGTYRRDRRALVQLPDPPNQAEAEGTESISAGLADTAIRRRLVLVLERGANELARVSL